MSDLLATVRLSSGDTARIERDGIEGAVRTYRRGDGRPLDEAFLPAETPERAVCEAILYLGLHDERVLLFFGSRAGQRIEAAYLLDQWTDPTNERGILDDL